MSDDPIALPRLTDTAPGDWLIERYVAGECIPRERVVMERWVQANPELGRVLATMSFDAAAGRDGRTGPVDEQLGDRRILARIGARVMDAAAPAGGAHDQYNRANEPRQNGAPGLRHVKSTHRRVRSWVGVIVASLALTAIGTAVWRSGHTNAVPSAVSTYTTGTGQLARLVLKDGTRVTLAPRTTLRVPASFGVGGRTVSLDGEADFQVFASGGSPFTARSGGVTTRVLGTRFVVRRYPGDPGVRVAVTSGKVSVTSSARPTTSVALAAGRAVVATDSSITAVEPNTARYTEWLDGQLVFRHAPVNEVLATLSRWYGYEFHLTDPALANGTLTVSVSTQSSADALAALKFYLNVNLEFSGNVITLTPRRVPPAPTPAPRDRDALTTHSREVGR